MDVAAATFTSTEYEAFNRLFDSIQRVIGTDEHRLVDPAGRIACLFEIEEDATAFVRKLVSLGLMEFVFVGPECEEGRRRETYRAYQERWPDAASSVRRVPDPPFLAEERRVRDAVARHREHRQALADRRAGLAREIAAIDAGIAETDGKIAEAEKLGAEFAALRERFAKCCNDAA